MSTPQKRNKDIPGTPNVNGGQFAGDPERDEPKDVSLGSPWDVVTSEDLDAWAATPPGIEAEVIHHPSALARPLAYGDEAPADRDDPYYTARKICPACNGSGQFDLAVHASGDYLNEWGTYEGPEDCPACDGHGETTSENLDRVIDQYAAAVEGDPEDFRRGLNADWAYANKILAEHRKASQTHLSQMDEEWAIPSDPRAAVAWPGTVDYGEPPF
jgi:hypothetical protein